MVFGFGSKPATTIQEEDPKGTKQFPFSFGTRTRGQLQQQVEDLLTTNQHTPLVGAEQVLDMFSIPQNEKILNESPSVQSVVLGTGNHTGPVAYFLAKAAEQLERPGASREDQARFDRLTARYAGLLERVETARVLAEDPEGRKQYKFSFGTMTGSELQQRIEDVTTQYASAGMHAEGAQKLMDMFASPQDTAILVESAAIRHRVLGGSNGQGPIDFMLDKAEEHVGRGEGSHAANARLGQLSKQYERLRSDALGKKPLVRQPTGSHMLGVYNPDGPDGPSRYS